MLQWDGQLEPLVFARDTFFHSWPPICSPHTHLFRTNCISLTHCLAIVYEDILMMHADAEQTLKLLLQRMAVRGNGMVNFCKSST